jgi:hypothetical protein
MHNRKWVGKDKSRSKKEKLVYWAPAKVQVWRKA